MDLQEKLNNIEHYKYSIEVLEKLILRMEGKLKGGRGSRGGCVHINYKIEAANLQRIIPEIKPILEAKLTQYEKLLENSLR